MKKLNLFSFALAALMLGACSNDLDVKGTDSVTVLPGETGYISLAINLPTAPSTRVNDDFDDGIEAEYTVKDATLLIFSGASEDVATLSGIYPLTGLTGDATSADDDNITSTHKITQAIKKPASGNVYALVIVNKGNVLTGSGDSWSLNGTALTVNTTTLSAFNATAQTLSADDLADLTTKGFFMTNAPLYTAPGGTTEPAGAVKTLAEVNPNNIYSTADEAEDNPATSIYVERAVAKVTVTGAGGNLTNKGGLTSAAYTLSGWTLDVTNTKTYIVRNVSEGANWWGLKSEKLSSDDYRFVGSVPVGNQLYRTYWGVDPNYSAEVLGDFNKLEGTTLTSLTSIGSDDYCLENTFNVDNQNENQTTRVIVAATLNGGADFYTIDNNTSTIYTQENALKAIKAEYLSNPVVIAALTDGTTGLEAGKSIGEADLTVTFDGDKATDGGDLTVAEITIDEGRKDDFKGDVIPTVLTATGNDAIITAVNNGIKVSYYKGGISYYPVKIKHFGDDQTHWATTDAQGSDSYPEPNANANWLGRYGVLRNNWYTINVTGIRGIGKAEVPEVYGTPDDPAESYISVEINVLSWAKRSQSVDL